MFQSKFHLDRRWLASTILSFIGNSLQCTLLRHYKCICIIIEHFAVLPILNDFICSQKNVHATPKARWLEVFLTQEHLKSVSHAIFYEQECTPWQGILKPIAWPTQKTRHQPVLTGQLRCGFCHSRLIFPWTQGVLFSVSLLEDQHYF